MNNFKQKNTAEELAVNEGTICAKELLEEIEPLLREYFIGGFELTAEAIILNFKNGQKFRLTVEEVKG